MDIMRLWLLVWLLITGTGRGLARHASGVILITTPASNGINTSFPVVENIGVLLQALFTVSWHTSHVFFAICRRCGTGVQWGTGQRRD
jgi:hypothetical protein